MSAADFVSCLRTAGWIISDRLDSDVELTPSVSLRYSPIPPPFLEFLRLADLCVHRDEDAWFLTSRIYNDTGEFAFAWNEWELLSLRVAEDAGDSEWAARIHAFWDCHLPIAMSVRSGYSYLALAIGNNSGSHQGTVLYGREPEFEDVSIVSPSVTEFFSMVSGFVVDKIEQDYLSDFL